MSVSGDLRKSYNKQSIVVGLAGEAILDKIDALSRQESMNPKMFTG